MLLLGSQSGRVLHTNGCRDHGQLGVQTASHQKAPTLTVKAYILQVEGDVKFFSISEIQFCAVTQATAIAIGI